MPESLTFEVLSSLGQRPPLFSVSSTRTLWTDPHISENMLKWHLDPDAPLASGTHDTIDHTADWLARRLDIGAQTRLCDFGCGPGLYTTRWARDHGARVTGIDFSPRSIAYARETAARHGLEVTYHEADYLSVSLDHRFDVITLIFCDLCPLSPTQRQALYAVWRSHLEPGGRIALDVATLARFETLSEGMTAGSRLMDGFWAAGDYVGIHETMLYQTAGVSLDRYSIFEPDGRAWAVCNWLQHFSPDEIIAELEAAGFVIEGLYGNLTGSNLSSDSDEIGIIARLDES